MAAATLAVRVTAQIGEFQSAFKETSKSLDKFHKDFENTATRASAVGTFLGNTFTKLASSIAGFVSSTISDAVRLSSEFSNAFIGLDSVAAAFGQDVSKVRDAAKSLSKDGLLPLKDAAGGLKNLLAAGFNLEQSTNLMNAFKDSAAFGRQAALSFGDAVRSATEGVKNGNSAVVDNAGVTKNLSNILVEAGFAASDLGKASTNAGVRMALYNGILKETRAQLGDAEKLTKTYTGAITKLETAYDTFLAMLGDAITQNETLATAIGLVSEAFIDLTGNFKSQQQLLTAVSDGVIALVRAFAALINVIDLVQTAYAALRIVANTFFQAFVAGALAIAEGTAKIASTMKFLDPKNWAAWEAAGRDAAGMVDFLSGAVEGFDRDSIAAQKQSEEWGNKLQGVRAKALDLATTLGETRGKAIEFGAATKKSGDDAAAGVAKADAATKAFAKSFANLQADIKLASADSTMAELVEEFGKKAEAMIPKADRLKLSVAELTREVAKGFAIKQAAEQLAEFTREVEKAHAETREDIRLRIIVEGQKAGDQVIATIDAAREAAERLADVKAAPFAAELAKIERARRAEIAAIEATADADSALRQQQIRDTNAYYDHLRDKALGTFDTIVDRMGDIGIHTKAALDAMRDAAIRDFEQMKASGQFNAAEIQTAFERMNAAIVAAGGKAKIDWKKRFEGLIDAIKDAGLEAAHGLAEALADGIKTGDWSQLENNLKDVFANLLGNVIAAAVDFLVPGLGQALKPLFTALADKFLGWLGLGTAGRDAVKEFAESFEGGFDGLRQELRALGEEGERLWVNLTQRVARGSEEEAQAAIAAINAAFAAAEKGMKNFADGAMKRIKAFAATVKTASGGISDDLRKMVEMEMPELEMGIDEANARKAMAEFASTVGQSREALQAEFSRLGLYAGTAFAETLRDEGLAAALEVAGPMFDELNALSAEFGFTLEGSAAQFAEFFRVAKENEDVVSALEAITQMIEGACDAMFLTQELFSAFGTDAVAQFDELIARGVPLNQALALSQSSIQALWEAQQRFGLETDAATQALIDQGVAAGIVGANQMDVNERILQVLIAIADTFNADIPAGLRATERQSRQTAQNMSRDFEETGRRAKTALQIDVPDIEVKVNFEVGEVPEMPDFNIPQLATGGIVRKPTLAVIGEKGPEAVIPLRGMRESAFLAELREMFNGPNIPRLQHGGIVRSPTLALVGENGPEAVIPLSQMGASGPEGTTVILEIDGRAMGEVLVPWIPHAVTRLGLGI